ncbi:RDD family protein, partial [Candidatus Sumerlaeota bacterium]|nr:RDD family protein [Candidatus Sumerlaeota bacterium]
PIEATVALQALLRRDRLDPLARVRLFSEIAAHFRSLAEFPADSVEGLSDEQYIRNAVEILFDRRK